MMELFPRIILVFLGATGITFAFIKCLGARYFLEEEIPSSDLWLVAVAGCSAGSVIGVMLVDQSAYSKSALFYWGFPLLMASLFGILSCWRAFLIDGDVD